MHFRQILHDQRSCASYIVGCQTLGTSAIVDPQGDPRFYIDHTAEMGMAVTAVMETHIHADHLSAAQELSRATGAPHYLGPGAQVGFAHETLADGQMVRVGNRRITAIHTPGHTPEHICLSVDDWFVLTGDTLFIGDVGRVDLSLDGADEQTVRDRASLLYDSLRRLLSLPDWMEVYPGHYAGSTCGRGMDGKTISTIGRERRYNRPLQLSQREFIDFQVKNIPPLPEDFHTLKRMNLGFETSAPHTGGASTER
jgi:glyoxylase-like metal-dependent hydrolase (beta-lactamase superfamily II)